MNRTDFKASFASCHVLAMFAFMSVCFMVAVPSIGSAQVRHRCDDCTAPHCRGCEGLPPPAYYEGAPGTETPPTGDDSITVDPGLGDLTTPPPALDSNLLASSFGAGFGAMSAAPNMMGDLFGAPGASTIVGRRFICSGDNLNNRQIFCAPEMRTFEHVGRQTFDQFGQDTNGDGFIDFLPNLEEVSGVSTMSLVDNGPFFGVATDIDTDSGSIIRADIFEQVILEETGPGSGIVLGRLKIAENNSPLPRDRVFVNYSHFTNVPLFPGGVNVNRITPGFEKTLGDSGLHSLEFRFPFGTSLDNDITADGVTSTNKALVGNMMIVYKALLNSGPDWAVSGGASITLPTARDIRVGLADGTELVRINNESIHLSPYIAYLASPNDNWFFQAFLQAEFDATGNGVDAQGTGGGMDRIGRVNDTNYLYFDVGGGYYLYRDRFDRTITSIAPIAELHWNKTLQASDVVSSGGVQIGNEAQDVDILNGVIGLNMTLGRATHVTVGYTAPIGSGDNRQFDGEFRLLVNRFFGSN